MEGCLLNGLEEGEWRVYADSSVLLEKGVFKHGLRNGDWFYPLNLHDSVIRWKTFAKTSNQISFNIPEKLEVVEQDSFFVKFINLDSSKLFNLVVAASAVSPDFQVEQYYQNIEQEIMNHGMQFESDRQKIVTQDDKVYFSNKYLMSSRNSDTTILFNFYTKLGNKLIEVNCRCSNKIEVVSKMIFFSVFTNLFIADSRIFNPFDKVKSVLKA
jgi:hypothetical protein